MAYTPQTIAQGFPAVLFSQMSPANPYMAAQFIAQRGLAIRFNQIMLAARKLPPYTDEFSAARLIIYEGGIAESMSGGSLIAGLDTWAVNVPAFNPKRIYLNHLFTAEAPILSFAGGLQCSFDVGVTALLLAPYHKSDTAGTPPTTVVSCFMSGSYVSRDGKRDGELVWGY